MAEKQNLGFREPTISVVANGCQAYRHGSLVLAKNQGR